MFAKLFGVKAPSSLSDKGCMYCVFLGVLIMTMIKVRYKRIYEDEDYVVKRIIKFYIYVVLGFLGNKEPRIVNMDHVSY